VGPGNAARQMTVRNPLDRITHASRDGGLHHFLEFSRGQSFNVQLVIRNPQASDLGLLSLWQREMDDGLLRLGALSSVGRGRVKVVEAGYRLWQRANAPAFQGMDKFIAEESESQDILAGLWQSHTLPTQSLSQFEQYVFTQA
jgi:CRISPR/Cas system CSM-associated protein Csm3 (group 7 of RAMP superfamily)